MNSSDIWPNLFRFLGLTALQVLLFKNIGDSLGTHFNVLVYPLFIMLLPMSASTPVTVILGFLIGLTVDAFYLPFGLHAGAGAFSGYIRSYLLNLFEPRARYSGKETIPSPHVFDWQWFAGYSALFMLLHCLWYFSMDEFTFVYIGTIALRTLSAWALSTMFVFLIVFLFNPKR